MQGVTLFVCLCQNETYYLGALHTHTRMMWMEAKCQGLQLWSNSVVFCGHKYRLDHPKKYVFLLFNRLYFLDESIQNILELILKKEALVNLSKAFNHPGCFGSLRTGVPEPKKGLPCLLVIARWHYSPAKTQVTDSAKIGQGTTKTVELDWVAEHLNCGQSGQTGCCPLQLRLDTLVKAPA